MKNSVSILIDGSNFYFKLKSFNLSNQLKINFHKFNSHIMKKEDKVYSAIYYVGAIKTDGTIKLAKLHANQQKLLSHLKLYNYKYKLGYLMKNKNGMVEKGVDVHIATDILIQSYEKYVNRIYVVSSDTDLIPSISQAQKLGVEIVYVGFEKGLSKALKKIANKTIVLSESDILSFTNNHSC